MDVNDPTPNLMVFLIERYYLYKFAVVKYIIFMCFPALKITFITLKSWHRPTQKKSDLTLIYPKNKIEDHRKYCRKIINISENTN